MKQISVWGSVLTLAFFKSSAAIAHHSIAGTYDPDAEIVLENVTILDWRFAHPHAFLVFEAPNADGVLTEWRASTHSVATDFGIPMAPAHHDAHRRYESVQIRYKSIRLT